MPSIPNITIERTECLGYLTGLVQTEMKRYLSRKIKENNLGITFEQWRVLELLWVTDGLNQNELSSGSNKDGPSITRLVDNMVKRNLVVRVPDKTDRRTNLIYLTNYGSELQKKTGEVTYAAMKELLYPIDEDKLTICKEVLNQLLKQLLTHAPLVA